jgi:hypothetical protein
VGAEKVLHYARREAKYFAPILPHLLSEKHQCFPCGIAKMHDFAWSFKFVFNKFAKESQKS